MGMEKSTRTPPTTAEGQGEDSLLSGLMVDAAGRPMVLRVPATARAVAQRVYISPPSAMPAERVGAARVERNVVVLLQHLHLLGETWSRHDVAQVLRRVVVFPDSLVFQLDRRACLAVWRARGRLQARSPFADVLRLIGTWLPPDLEISDVGWVLCIAARRRSRTRRTAPPEAAA